MKSVTIVLLLSICAPGLSPAHAQKAQAVQPRLQGPCPQGATNLCIPLDSTFVPVVFDGAGGNGPADPGDPCQRNDDDITTAIDLQFTFDLYGQSFNQVFINNNGNVSFGQGFSTFTSTGFPVNGYPMVAPFWADVDTRALASGVVYYRSEAHRFTVIWDHVGYYSTQSDKTNTFELILSDGSDPLVGSGSNVCFCYDDMQWTTGSASGGSGGFGGTPATVGVNAGNGVDFFQIGRFDHEGTDYDGPAGNSDGVSFLDGQSTCFSLGGSVNQPPIFVNPPVDCLAAMPGAQLDFVISAIAPEIGQTNTLSVDAHGLANFTYSTMPGNPATASCSFTPDAMQTGSFTVTFTACDDFNPQACTSIDVCLRIPGTDCVTLNFDTEDDFTTPLVNGQHINDEFGRRVTITSAGNNWGPAIFDSTFSGPNNPSQDPDLLVDTGNLLILQTQNIPADASDVFPRPNDDGHGGTLTFTFPAPVLASSLRLVDADTSNASNLVILTDADGKQRTYTVPSNWTGDRTLAEPGQGTLDLTTLAPQPGFQATATASETAGFEASQVVRLDVVLAGSGGVDDVSWCGDEPTIQQAGATVRNGSGTNARILSSWSLPLLGGDWVTGLDCSGHASGLALLMIYDQRIAGIRTPFGEQLVAGRLLYLRTKPHTGSRLYFEIPIPAVLALYGVEGHVQAACTGAPGPRLSNALDVKLGF